MTSYNPVIKNGASGAIFYVSLLSQGTSGAFQSNPTLATGDVKISLDGGSLVNLGTIPAVTPASSKLVKVTLSQAETNADNIAIVFSDAAGAQWCDMTVSIQTVAKQFDDLPTIADVNAQVVDALATDTYAEPGQGVPAATTSLAAKINYLYKNWRNKKTQTSTQFSLFADDSTTVDHKSTVADDGTTATRGELVSGP